MTSSVYLLTRVLDRQPDVVDAEFNGRVFFCFHDNWIFSAFFV